MRVTLDIDETKLSSFLEQLNGLDYVQLVVDDISREQELETLSRWEAIESGKIGTRSWEEAKSDVFKR